MSNPMAGSKRLFAAVMLVLSVAALFLLLGNFKPFRIAAIANSRLCFTALYDRLPSAQIVMLGSSRMRRGIDPDQLAAELSLDPVTVINFGMPHGSSGRNHIFATEIMERAPRLQTLLVEVRYKPISNAKDSYADYIYWGGFPAVASIGELWTDIESKPSQSTVMGYRDFLHAVINKVELGLESIHSGRIIDVMISDDTGLRNNVCWQDRFGNPDKISGKGLKKEKQEFYKKHENWFDEGYADLSVLFESPAMERERFYLKKTAEDAKARGISVYFVLQPTYYNWPPSPEFKQQFEYEFGAPLIVPDKSKMKELIDAGFQDYSHLFNESRQIFTDFVVDEITSSK